MKKSLALVAVAALTFSLSGCASMSENDICMKFVDSLTNTFAMGELVGETDGLISTMESLVGSASGDLKSALESDIAGLKASDALPTRTATACTAVFTKQ